jgi:hypothetical protein
MARHSARTFFSSLGKSMAAAVEGSMGVSDV